MLKTSTKRQLLSTSVIAGLFASAGVALAQNADQPGQKPSAPTIGGSSTSALPTADKNYKKHDHIK